MKTGLKKEDSLALKGIGILLMIFHHCYRTAERFEGYEIEFYPFQQGQIVQLALYAKICVSIFVFISGYGLMAGYLKENQRTSGNISRWVGRHLISTVSGYWFVAVLSYIVLYVRYRDMSLTRIGQIFLDCAGLSSLVETKSLNGSWWYIGTAITFIIFFPLLAYGLDAFGGIACIAIVFLLPRISGVGFQGGRNPNSFLMIFIVGMICFRYDLFGKYDNLKLAANKKINYFLKFFLLFILVFLGVWSYGKVELKTLWEYHYAVIPIVLILFCVKYLFRATWLKRILQFLGKNSLNIWLTHTFFRDYLGNFVWSVKLFWLVPIVILALSLVLSICIDFLKRITGYDKLIHIILGKLK